MFRTDALSIIRSFTPYTQQWYMSYSFADKCEQNQDQTERNSSPFGPTPARKLSAKLYDIYHCCVYSEKLLMMDRGIVRNM